MTVANYPGKIEKSEWIRAAKLADIAYMEPAELDDLFRAGGDNLRSSNFNFLTPSCVSAFEHELVSDVVSELNPDYRFIQSAKTGTDVYMYVNVFSKLIFYN